MWRSTYRQRVSSLPGSNVSARDTFDDYADWCEDHDKELLTPSLLLPQAQSPRRGCLPNFSEESKAGIQAYYRALSNHISEVESDEG